MDVIDNGIGIGPEQFKLLFAPGFTSKADGSGLGLHASANFAIAAGGGIRPFSEGIGKGTTMRVRLRLSSLRPNVPPLPPPIIRPPPRRLTAPGART